MSLFQRHRRYPYEIDQECSCGSVLRVRSEQAAVALEAQFAFKDEHALCGAVAPDDDLTSRAPEASDGR